MASLGLKVLIMAIEPIRALVRREIDLVQHTPDTGAANGRGSEREHRQRDAYAQAVPQWLWETPLREPPNRSSERYFRITVYARPVQLPR
jgi:hypothetical protein